MTATAIPPKIGTGTDAGRISVPAMSGPMNLPKDREAEARKEAGVGIGLADDLRSIRTALAKAKLAGDFEAAFDLMLFQLGRSVFTDGYKAHALDIAVRETADRPAMRMNDADFASWSPGEAMLEDRSGLSFDWLAIDDDGESFAALRELSQGEKQALFAACVARTVKGQLAFEPQARPELEATVARLDIDFAQHVRPTADMLWSRVAKGRILDIARSVLSPAWASARSKNKKPDLAKAMEQAFAAAIRRSGSAPTCTPPRSPGCRPASRPSTPPGRRRADDTVTAEPEQTVDASGPEPAAGPETDEAPRTAPAVESIDSPAEAERVAPARAAANGHAEQAAPETGPSGADDGNDAGNDGRIAGTVDTAIPEDAAGAADGMPPAHINGRDAAPDPLEIPEFLRRVH